MLNSLSSEHFPNYVVILDAYRNSSVILEADRSHSLDTYMWYFMVESIWKGPKVRDLSQMQDYELASVVLGNVGAPMVWRLSKTYMCSIQPKRPSPILQWCSLEVHSNWSNQATVIVPEVRIAAKLNPISWSLEKP